MRRLIPALLVIWFSALLITVIFYLKEIDVGIDNAVSQLAMIEYRLEKDR